MSTLKELAKKTSSAAPLRSSAQFASLPPENDQEGNQEYKWLLPSEPDEEKFEHLVSQLLWRMDEGRGEALYELGVHDDGSAIGTDPAVLEVSLATLRRMADAIDAEATVLAQHDGTEPGTRCAEVLVRRRPGKVHGYMDLRLAIAGNVDAGKSSLIGCLTRSMLDDGRGAARSAIFNHPHEIMTGRTSSVALHLLSYNVHGACLNTRDEQTWVDLMNGASKVATLYDLAGHERYLKTTVRGMAGQLPDYALLLVAANNGVTHMTREHMSLCLALRVPMIAVVTKIDIAPAHIAKQTLSDLKHFLKSRGVRRMTLRVDKGSDLLEAAKLVSQNASRVVPLFHLSSVTGEGLDLLRAFINVLPPRVDWSATRNEPTEVQIDEVYTVQGVGTVVGGNVVAGSIRENQENLLLGPTSSGEFFPVAVRSIHCKRSPVRSVPVGHSAGFALRKVKRDQVRRGMVLVDAAAKPQAYWEFEAEVGVLYHSTTIRRGYTPVIQSMNVRQCARMIDMYEIEPLCPASAPPAPAVPPSSGAATTSTTSVVSSSSASSSSFTKTNEVCTPTDDNDRKSLEVLRTGSRALCRFRFLYRPERLMVGARLVITEEKTKALGVIRQVFPGTASSNRRRPGGGRRRRRRGDGAGDPRPPHRSKK